jgi:NADPH-dependent ferric siderophore reductase
MSETKSSRGWQGTVLKLLRAGDYELTVTGRHLVTEHYLRLSFVAGGMLADRPVHPTMWVRMWFPDGGRVHQRGYTLVDPDPEADTVDIEFALHDGIASRWALAAQPGDTIEVTVLGSNFVLPDPAPAGYVIVGDCASLPAINSLLDAIGECPARVFIESTHADDASLPVRRRDTDIVRIDRQSGGEGLVRAVSEGAFDAAEHFGWVACDNRTTRAVVKALREEYCIPRKSIKAQAYWEA